MDIVNTDISPEIKKLKKRIQKQKQTDTHTLMWNKNRMDLPVIL